MEHSKHYLIRALAVVVGILMVGIAVGLFKLAEMGADPFTAMNTGISSVLNMQFGTLQLFVNAGILALIFLFKRQFIGFGTIINMVFVGYTADFVMWLVARLEIAFATIPVRLAVLAVAALLICVGDALYISADMGMAPYDAAGYVVETLTRGKLQFRIARIILDAICVGIAFFTGTRYADGYPVEDHRHWNNPPDLLHRAADPVFPCPLERSPAGKGDRTEKITIYGIIHCNSEKR